MRNAERSIRRIAWPQALLLLFCACGGGGNGGELFTDAEWEVVQMLSPLTGVPADPTNRYADDADAAALGQQLFFEKGYSGPIVVADDGTNGGLGREGETGKLSCRSCHLGNWMIDDRSNPNNTSLGLDWFFRNSPTLINVATYERRFGWVGFNDNLWGKCLIPAEFVMGTDRTGIAKYLGSNYREEYEEVFGEFPDLSSFPASGTPLAEDDPEEDDDAHDRWHALSPAEQDSINRIYANFGKALAAYLRSMVVLDSPFDAFVAGDEEAISLSAKRGLKLFVGKAGCVECHSGPSLTDEEFHNTGVAQEGEHVLPYDPEDDEKNGDPGRLGALDVYLSWDFSTAGDYTDDPSIDRTEGVTRKPEQQLGAFRTKGLRGVAETAPYMHTGHMPTLRDVVEFYDRGGDDSGFAGTKDELMVPLNLTDREVDDLVAFLETLTGEPPDAALYEDTSKSN